MGALTELGQAITLNASYAPALHWRANVLAEMGRLADARSDAERAATVDPLSASIANDYGNILLWSGDLEGAKLEFDRAQALDFGFAAAVFGTALVALAEEQPIPLQMSLTQWAALSGVSVTLAGELTTRMLLYRQTGVAQPVPDALTVAARSGRMTAGVVAGLHGLLGARAGAIEWLREAVVDRSWVDQYLRVNPAYDSVRDDPEFLEILEAVGA